jgi:hypothetical protein
VTGKPVASEVWTRVYCFTLDLVDTVCNSVRGGNGSGTLLFDRDLHICCSLGALYNGREDQWRY